jgi:hypothetical protein
MHTVPNRPSSPPLPAPSPSPSPSSPPPPPPLPPPPLLAPTRTCTAQYLATGVRVRESQTTTRPSWEAAAKSEAEGCQAQDMPASWASVKTAGGGGG